MTNYAFENPEWFWGLFVLPILALWYWYKRRQQRPELSYSNAEHLAESSNNWVAYLRYAPEVLRIFAIGLLIIAMARPRTSEESTKTKGTQGIDIMMAIDVSTSMLSRDLRPNRLEATKKVAANFVEKQKNDRIGLVIYAGESYTQTPLTTDHGIVLNAIDGVKNGLIEDGTAIGMGLGTGVNRLKDSKAKSKVIILLTDGENNRGEIDPLTAASLAAQYNIRCYTIGVGTKGTAMSPIGYDYRGGYKFGRIQVNIDEKLLKEIASVTNGKYFRATDNKKLQEIYEEIAQLETTKLQELKFYTYDEKFVSFALWALGLFLFEIVLRFTLLRSFI
jgi:Ca-activated chloride channel family protein